MAACYMRTTPGLKEGKPMKGRKKSLTQKLNFFVYQIEKEYYSLVTRPMDL